MKQTKNKAMKRWGFTLIELLIVVAIIAILALIAIPNFLEAQTRSKVGRCKADMRSLATAVETYAVDWTRYPLHGRIDKAGNVHCPSLVTTPGDRKKFPCPSLTTPVAYVTTIFEDPFSVLLDGAKPHINWYVYHNHQQMLAQWQSAPPPRQKLVEKRKKYGEWWIVSCGPDRDYGDCGRDLLYDATNGTVSDGDIIRSQRLPEGGVMK